MTEREWMAHSVMILKERVEKFNPRAEVVADPARLLMQFQHELAWREYVLKAVHAGAVGRLNPAGRVWFRYMRDHARLQVARSGREISDELFHAKAQGLRVMRDVDLRMLSKGQVA